MNLSRNGYSHDQVKQMLHGEKGTRDMRFRYHLLDEKDNFIAELDQVEGGSVEFSSFSDIKRTAKIDLKEDSYQQETFMTWQDIGARDWSEM